MHEVETSERASRLIGVSAQRQEEISCGRFGHMAREEQWMQGVQIGDNDRVKAGPAKDGVPGG